jgi:hypothetical protein
MTGLSGPADPLGRQVCAGARNSSSPAEAMAIDWPRRGREMAATHSWKTIGAPSAINNASVAAAALPRPALQALD